MEWEYCDPIHDSTNDPVYTNITNADSNAVAHISSQLTLSNNLNLNLEMSHSALHINLKEDFSERTIFLQATTRGDNKVEKEIFLGVKKAC
jgi:hypothetical protein